MFQRMWIMAPLDYITGSVTPLFGHTFLKQGARRGAGGEIGADRPQFRGAYAHTWSSRHTSPFCATSPHI
jgi:hypothetical protein